MIDGDCPTRICPHCGKGFSILTENEQGIYNQHIQNHKLDTLNCDCEGVDKLKTLADKQKHIKLHHSNGREAIHSCSMRNYGMNVVNVKS